MKISDHQRRIAKPLSAGANEGWAVLSTLIAGFLVWGGIGWLLDHWWGTRLMTPIGLLIGMALGIYAVVRRFGTTGVDPTTNTAPQNTPPRTTSGSAAVSPTAPRATGQPPAGTRRETECP